MAELSLLTKTRTFSVVKYTRQAAIFQAIYAEFTTPGSLGAGPQEKRVIVDLTQSMDSQQKDV